MRTPFVKKKVLFQMTLKFCATFSSTQVVCIENTRKTMAEDIECLKVLHFSCLKGFY